MSRRLRGPVQPIERIVSLMRSARFLVIAFPALTCSVLVASGCGSTDTSPVATHLLVTTQPSSTAQSGVAFAQQPVVQLRDASGNNVSQAGVAITAGIATGGGTLGGTRTVETNGSGQAIYTNLVITGAGAHTLSFTGTDLEPDASTTIDLGLPPGTQLVITTQPADTARSGVAFARQPVVQLRDAANNNMSQGGVSVTVTLATGSGNLGGMITVQTNSSGQAVYTDLVITGAGAHTLSFAAPGPTPAASSSITLPTPLQYDVPTTAFSGEQASARWFILEVAAGAGQFVVSTDGGTGDADLYVRYSALPDTFPSNFDCRSISETTAEQCTIDSPSAGPWFILVYGYKDFSGVSLTVTPCTLSSPGDTDGDRLPDCVETNSGEFVSQLNTGTKPNDRDTDDDSIRDGDEVLGTLLGLDLPAMGVSPLRADILIEYDWFDDGLQPERCGPHSHRPTTAALDMVTTAFANGPIINPGGTNGINIIHDYGQGGVFTGGNLIADADGVLAGSVGDAEYLNHKSANFSANRNGYFHYAILAHFFDTDNPSSGVAIHNGDDLVVSVHCPKPDLVLASTIMHELGHNLSLLHGGDNNVVNYKPNYNSIMNYRYQLVGVDNNCTPPGDGVLDYSYGTRPPLFESNLDETQGICGNPPGPGWDWNGDGDALDTGLSLDINVDPTGGEGDDFIGSLHDYNDWGGLYSGGITDATGALLVRKEIITCMPFPSEGQ
jgi:hypothetical protein